MPSNASGKAADGSSIYEPEKYAVTPIAGAVVTPIDKLPWEYEPTEGDGRTDKVHGVMGIPTGDDPEEVWTRMHELTHAVDTNRDGFKGSPSRKPRNNQLAYEAIEEARINTWLQQQKMLPEWWEGDRIKSKRFFNQAQEAGKSGLFDDRMKALSAIVLGEDDKVDTLVSDPKAREFIHRLFKEHTSNPLSNENPQNNKPWAKEFDEIYVPPPKPPPMPAWARGKGHGKDDVKKKGEERIAPVDWPDLPPEGHPPIKMPMVDAKDGWGPMEFQYPPLGRPSKASLTVKSRFRRVDSGAVIRAPHRIITDGYVFRIKRKQKVQGGSILLDGSGSMGLSYEDIEELLQAAPAATIAMYSGDNKQGFCRILAKNGKMATKDHYNRPGNNLVDGPALRDWLGKQEEPRYWISDGQVTGAEDSYTRDLHGQAIRICTEFKIKRIQDIPSALKMLKEQNTKSELKKVDWNPS